jgi:hypothetical protein
MIINGLDQPEDLLKLSVAFALIWYVADLLQEWFALALAPEAIGPTTEVVPSPQSKVYSIWSPSGSIEDV